MTSPPKSKSPKSNMRVRINPSTACHHLLRADPQYERPETPSLGSPLRRAEPIYVASSPAAASVITPTPSPAKLAGRLTTPSPALLDSPRVMVTPPRRRQWSMQPVSLSRSSGKRQRPSFDGYESLDDTEELDAVAEKEKELEDIQTQLAELEGEYPWTKGVDKRLHADGGFSVKGG